MGPYWALFYMKIKLRNIISNFYFVYVFLLVFLFPLVRSDYSTIANTKWEFFRQLSLFINIDNIIIPSLLPILFVLMIIDILINKDYKFSFCDVLVLTYALVNVAGSIFALDKEVAVYGYGSWHMGLLAQLSFVLIYFLSKRYLKRIDILIYAGLLSSFIVFFICILNRFRLNLGINGIYEDSFYMVVDNFLSTIGNINWLACYMMIYLPLASYLFMCEKKKIKLFLLTIYLIISFMSLIINGSDSLYIGLAVIFVYLFCLKGKKFKLERYLSLISLFILASRILNVLKLLFPNHHSKISVGLISFFCDNSIFWYILVFLILLIILVKLLRLKISVSRTKLMFICIIVALSAIGLYISLNSLKLLPDYLLSDNQYLNFSYSWGNNRALLWSIALQLYKRILLSNPFIALIGAGPDNFPLILDLYMHKDLLTLWTGFTIQNPHCEVLTILVNNGLIGLASYLALIVLSFKNCYKSIDKTKRVATIVVLVYFIHSLVSFQQINSTPLLFITLGLMNKE